MRIVLLGAESSGLGAELAKHLQLDYVTRPEAITSDRFVLDGAPKDLEEARRLDAVLRARGAEVEVVLRQRGGADAVLSRYRKRIVELDPGGDPLESALSGLREALLST